MSAAVQSNSALIATYLEAVIRKDAAAVDKYFHPDVEYVVNGVEARDRAGALPLISEECRTALPWLGLHRGRAAVKVFLAHMHRNLEVTAFGPREVVSEGNRAGVFGWFRLHALPTGRTVDISYSIFFELRDALIVRYHFLENTFDVAAAFRAGGAWEIDTDGMRHRIPDSAGNEEA